MLTIGVPIFNEEDTLGVSLDSIILSASRLSVPFNIVCCFNGTTDNGREIAKKYPVDIIESKKGKPSAVRAIVDYSVNADEFIFVDADVIVDEHCFKRLFDGFSVGVVAVAGRPIPLHSNNLVYNVLNARMLHHSFEVSFDGSPKEFLHGRIYGVRKHIFDEINSSFAGGIGDDTFLSHYILLNYGRDAIGHVSDANVSYSPVSSIKSWYSKWSRIWKDLDNLYSENPEFLSVKTGTMVDWKNLPIKLYPLFVAERTLHYIGRTYFDVMKHFVNYEWVRLDDTKKVKL